MSDYTKQDWKDGTDGGTPITAARLAHIEDGIAGHAHSASDVTSGTLSADRLPTVPIAHGGTGATTAAAALTALGAASASDLATVRDSVSQRLPFTSQSPVSDFDDLTTTGFYSVEGTHSPSGSSSVWYAVLVMEVAGNANYVTQLAMATGTNSGAYFRSLDDGTWGPWRTL